MKFYSKSIGYFEVFLFIVLIVIYYYLTFKIDTDIPHHAEFIKEYIDGKKGFQVNFLYYLLVYSLSFFSSNIVVLFSVSVIVLSIATFFKYFIVKKILISELFGHYKNLEIVTTITSFVLIISFSLPSIMIIMRKLYTMSLPPNVWHNSTTIAVMPFVVLLFWLSDRQLYEFDIKRLIYIGLLVIVSALIKPSFLFVYLIVYPAFLFRKFLFSKLFWINLIPLLVAVVIIFVEYYLIYLSKVVSDNDKNSISIDLFYLANIKFANGNVFKIIVLLLSTIISSLLFPLVVLFRNKTLIKIQGIQFAVFSIVVAFIIGNLFIETGDRAFHGNLFWQNIMCSFLLFFICTLHLLKLIALDEFKYEKYRIEIAALALHFVFGILYLAKIFITTSYS